MACHRSFCGAPCAGAGLTPIPVPAPERVTAATVGCLTRWDFLALPMVTLLHLLRADVREVAEPGFAGSIAPVAGRSWWRWVVRMPVGGDPLDHDLTVRALLATVHGVDVAGWPNGVGVRGV